MPGLPQQGSQSGRGGGVSLPEYGLSREAKGVANSLRPPSCQEYRWAGGEDCRSAGGERDREGYRGLVCLEAWRVQRARAYGRKIRTEFVGRNRSQQEKELAATDLCAGDSVRWRTDGAIACESLFVGGRAGVGKGRRTFRSRRSRPEGGVRNIGVFFRADESAADQEAG